MNYVDFLWDCRAKAELGISKIPRNSPVLRSIRGMSTDRTRHCMNNLNRYGKNYLEVGSYCGSTFVSSLYAQDKQGWSIDNFSEFCDLSDSPGQDGTHKDELLSNIDKYLNCPVEFFQTDSFEFDLSNIKDPVDVFMYDGDHDQDKHKKSLEYFYPVLNDVFLFIVDDWNSQAVRDGTYEGMKSLGLSIIAELPIRTRRCSSGDWWNGLYMCFLAKECPEDRFLQTSFSIGGVNYAHPIKDSRPRDVVLRLLQPENNKTDFEIEEIIRKNFPKLSDEQVSEELGLGHSLFKEQAIRGTF